MPNDDQWMATDSSPKESGRLALEWLPFRKRKGSHEEQVRSILNDTPMFEGIGHQDWRLLSNLFHERKYEQGESVFEKGMPGLGMYIILDGDVSIVGNSENGDRVLAKLTTGDFFGEMAVIQEGVRSATAVADRPSELIGIFRPQLRDLLKDRPRLGSLLYERLAQVLADRLRLADDMILEKARQAGESEE